MTAVPDSLSAALAHSPQLRDQLGLDEDESVRLLHSSPCTLLFERIGSAAPIALPWDRDLVLIADVRAFPLADFLGLVHEAGKSGFLFFAYRDHAKSIYFHRGEVVFASSNVKVDRIGECLLRAGALTLEQLREAERCHTPPTRFGKVLVERGFLTPRELWQGVKYQVEELVRSLFSYTAGHVFFWEGEIQPDNVVRLSLPTRRLVAEGIERRDELFKFLALLEDPRVRLEPVAGSGDSLEGNERAVFDALARESAFPALCRQAGLDPLSAARTVQLLRVVGRVKVVRTADDAAYVGESDLRPLEQDAVAACVETHVKLLAELAAPIVAVEGARPLCERLERVLSDTAQRFPALLEGLQIGASATLDPEEILGRAVRLPGDRVQMVGAALGELVSYLEFELRNHPRVDDPDAFLSGLEDLRAKIDA